MEEAASFCQDGGFSSLFLWTVNTLPVAARLYRSVGFRETEELTHKVWGSAVTEVKYQLELK